MGARGITGINVSVCVLYLFVTSVVCLQVVPNILQQGGQEDRGENARMQCYIGAIAIGDMMKSTLGPRGMDKILMPMGGEGGFVQKQAVTNDGATILNSIWIDNPAARILVDVSKRQDQECGDGTTGVVVLAAELLRVAEKLVDRRVHPQTIISGFLMALETAKECLVGVSFQSTDDAQLRENLMRIAKTTLSSKILSHDKEHFAGLAVEAVMRLKNKNNLSLIQILKKKGGICSESRLDEGFILEKRFSTGHRKRIEDAKIMVANTPMDTDKIKILGAKVNAEDFDTVANIEQAEKEKMKRKVEKIAAHGCNVFINRQLIYNYPEQLLKERGVSAIEHSDFDGMERLAAALGAEIVSTFDSPEMVKLGTCRLVEEVLIGEEKAVRFSGCEQPEACTIILRGANEHVLDEAERSLHDALAVVAQTCQQPLVVCGGGAAEMAMAGAVEKRAQTVEGKAALAMQGFADALRAIPTVLLDNGGFDSAEIVAKLRSCHAFDSHFGVDIAAGDVGNMRELGVYESYKAKHAQLCAAVEAAVQIIRVDNVIRCAPRQRQEE
ncbi:T-complex 1 subunit beta [Gregarina niphandrodes]|uniref:CCT-beta n=1 Tax=Gregarina niphandrodes TaxID=110365 RepID=A0A023AZQ2_GRENI|nr:T-complex 1 subunit beta [Gregarina niphandrodes]EZG44297.1 T-complex 1 subunit beta [Gregarina niphandrodes]|eukprot:XP_011132724.1 T-complex 1 subunit beta [Gregarina niphandrodes]